MSKGNMYRTDSPEKKGPNINGEISTSFIQVINPEGNNIGEMYIKDALNLATEYGLDLVEVAPNSHPPVCKIIDYGKYIYDQKKKQKENHTGKVDTKEIRLGVSTEKHDLEIKAKHAKEFLNKGHKVKLQVKFKGRENHHPELGENMIQSMVELIGGENVKMLQSPNKDGRFMSATLIKK